MSHSGSQEAITASDGPAAALVELAALATASGGDRRFERELVRAFLADLGHTTIDIGDALQAQQPARLWAEAQRLSRAASSVGANTLRRAAEALMRVARRSDLTEAPALFAAITVQVERSRRFFEDYLVERR